MLQLYLADEMNGSVLSVPANLKAADIIKTMYESEGAESFWSGLGEVSSSQKVHLEVLLGVHDFDGI